MTEMMLTLGLADKVIYTCYTNAEPIPQLKDAFVKIPLLSARYPSHEELVAANPDLVLGQVFGFTEKNSGTVEMLGEKNIPAYIAEGTMAERESIDQVYEDILDIGKIFRVEERAEKVVADMKAKVKEAADKTKGAAKKARVFVVDSLNGNEIWTAGRSMETEAINLAGGVNVMEARTTEQWPTVSTEILLEENPDYLMFNSYGSTPVEEKIKAIEGNSALADLDAVKNKRYIIVQLQDVNESVRLADTVARLAREFYPNLGWN
jgi:iron complex transport system substrate-binding protein